MSDHLPECERHQPYYFPDSVVCICDRLRACEARVTAPSHYHDLGYDAGLAAARFAIRTLPAAWTLAGVTYVPRHEALAAIDALRGESE